MEEFTDIDADIDVHGLLLSGPIFIRPAKASYEPSLKQLIIVGQRSKIKRRWCGSLSIEVYANGLRVDKIQKII